MVEFYHEKNLFSFYLLQSRSWIYHQATLDTLILARKKFQVNLAYFILFFASLVSLHYNM